MGILDWLRGKKKPTSGGTAVSVRVGSPKAPSTLTADQIDGFASQGDIESLVSALRSPDLFIRGRAVIKLGALKDPRAVDALAEVLRTDEDWGIRENAVKALASIKDARSVDPLVAALRDQHRDVRMNAVLALGGIGDERAIPPIEELGRHDSYVTKQVEWALRELKAK